MYKKLFLYNLSIYTLLLIGCGNEKAIFEKNYDIKNGAWAYTDTLNFAFDIQDTMAIYDIVLTIEHTPQYPMQNIYTNIYTKFPKGERVKQLLSIDLADNSGTWQGDCSSSSCDFNIKIQENAFFNIMGSHLITLEQFTRNESLQGIKNIGLKIVDKGIKRDLAEEQKQKSKKKK